MARKDMVNNFLKKTDHSIEFPSTKDNKSGKRYGLTDTMTNLYLKFSKEYPSIHVSKAFFFRARDKKTIKLVKYTERRQCLCMMCENMRKMEKVGKITNVTELSTDELQHQLKKNLISNQRVRYQQWEKIEVDEGERIFKRPFLQDRSISRAEFIRIMMGKHQAYKDHCHRVRTQYRATSYLRKNLEEDECTIQVDYSENWTIKYQNEPSAIFYDNQQATIHPLVVHFKQNGQLTSKSYVCISDELSHAAPTTFTFISAVIPHVKNLLPNLQLVHFISESPSSQYRNKYIISLVAHFPILFNLHATWNWLEAGHGKGCCDGVGGSVKSKADNLVKAGSNIRNPKELASVLSSSDILPTVIYVPRKDIEKRRGQIEKWDITQVKGIMKYHTVVPIRGMLHFRELSCFEACCHKAKKPGCQGWDISGIQVVYSKAQMSDERFQLQEDEIEEMEEVIYIDEDDDEDDAENLEDSDEPEESDEQSGDELEEEESEEEIDTTDTTNDNGGLDEEVLKKSKDKKRVYGTRKSKRFAKKGNFYMYLN